MATMRAVAEGLQILMKHANPDEYLVDAQHGVIYAGPESPELPPADVAALEKLGWYLDSKWNCWAKFT